LHLILRHPHGQRQQLHHLVPPGSALAVGFAAGKWLLTLTTLRGNNDDDVHLLDRQQ